MTQQRFGIWFIGAWGGVSTTAAVGLAGLQAGLANETGLVTGLARFQKLELAEWPQFTIGGHEIRETDYAREAELLHGQSGVFSRQLLDAAAPILKRFDRNIRPGTLINVGPTIEQFAGPRTHAHSGETPRAAITRISADLEEFQTGNNLDHVIVVNLSSTEPPPDDELGSLSWGELSAQLESADASPVPASSIYAIAAMQLGCSYVNFTPSVGTNLKALEELALKQGTLHVGRDGKTGETLLKSVLAPMFAARNLQVKSWVGHNIFGNMDGKVLDDPVNKANKVHSKDHLLTEILGYKPQSLVSIEYIESMGDWKTAWDHIHFDGFLDTRMTMQFTWQGCDSLLAAPLVLDLVRLTEREWREGRSGVMTHLASFFKSPMGADVPAEFGRQWQMLDDWIESTSQQG
ncbi:MAG: myo-inositol-1-phosphate synthase [Planctomycetaceae bacterium]|nr:myo-inositol-1-phosphate synthase [Planctomycetaceae bacterium]